MLGAFGGEGIGVGLSGEWFENSETGDKYFGASASMGFGAGSPFEVHVTEAESEVYRYFNIFEELYKIFDHIESLKIGEL